MSGESKSCFRYNYTAFNSFIVSCHFVQNRFGLIQFGSVLTTPGCLSCSRAVHKDDTGAAVFIIRNLVPNNWALLADNPFKQM